jgi:hypothetical protein
MKVIAALMSLMLGTAVVAQEGAPLPANYKVQFENSWVKVTSVRYAPREKIAPHAHTPYPSAYVYLNDGPPVVFSHVGGKPATRAATKAGAFRIYRGLDEVHEAQNTGDAASEFLRVELKTTPAEPGSFFGKYERPAVSAEPIVHFNHPQVRISRVWIQPGQEVQIATAAEPTLVIGLTAGAGLRVGEARWVDASSRTTLRNTSATPVDVLRFDLRTRPRDTR